MAQVEPVDDVQLAEEKRLQESNKRLKKIWFIGHCATAAVSAIVAFSYLIFLHRTLVSRVLYRLAFTFATLTYGLSVYKKTGHSKTRVSTLTLLQFESFQYGALAFLWLISKHHLFKLIPYVIYSGLQIAGYLQAQKQDEKKSDDEAAAFNKKAFQLERFVAKFNIVLWLRLLLDVVMIVPGSGISLIAYSFFFRLTMEKGPAQDALDDLEDAVDAFMTKSFIPKALKGKWKRIKYAIDDYNSYQLTPDRPEPEQPEEDKASKKTSGTGENDTTTLMNGN